MKKRFSILIALVMLLAVALPVMAACDNDKTVASIEVVDAKTAYKVGDTIDYDSLKIKVTYDDKSTETKTVKELNAAVARADLSKEGNSSYTVTYSGKTATVNVTVTKEQVIVKNAVLTAYRAPAFYSNFLINSKDRGQGEQETKADFRSTGRIYEVGNANKFVFRPTGAAFDQETDDTVDIDNVKTTVKVYSKDTVAGSYKELTGDDLTAFVTVDNNTYKFSDAAADKFVKLEVAIDTEEYDVDEEQLPAAERIITAELLVVGGGYNAYDQLGLSVMCDIQKLAWADLWGVKVEWNTTSNKYEFGVKQGVAPVQLAADDKPLYQYVDNITTVILHNAITLDANQMPAMYFWTAETEGYNTALDSLTGLPKLQEKLIGSLNDGLNNDFQFRTTDVVPGGTNFDGGNYGLNMQKGMFATKKVSVAGNYNSIIVPENEVKNGRNFFTVVDQADSTPAATPVSHSSVFQFYQPTYDGVGSVPFTVRNLAMSGNCPKQQVEDITAGQPVGLMLANVFSIDFTLDNVVADKFYTNVVLDSYGDTGLNVINTKMYDSYSNMCFLWRSTANVENSELIGAGGPLFILEDGSTNIYNAEQPNGDDQGSQITVDSKSVLQSYATGAESWYASYDATPLVQAIASMDAIFKGMGKTILTKQNDKDYLNLIGVIICEPTDLFAGLTNGKLDVCGSYTTKDGENVAEEFKMHSTMLMAIQAATGADATNYPVIFQLGDKFACYAPTVSATALLTVNENPASAEDFLRPLNQTELAGWVADTSHTKMAIYMSAAIQTKSPNAPYFGVILGISQLPQA